MLGIVPTKKGKNVYSKNDQAGNKTKKAQINAHRSLARISGLIYLTQYFLIQFDTMSQLKGTCW